jgi:hypothetical protein
MSTGLESETFWLDLTNIGLGVVTLVCLVAIGLGVVQELLPRLPRHTAREDDHALLTPELGWTMADGGRQLRAKEDPAVLVAQGSSHATVAWHPRQHGDGCLLRRPRPGVGVRMGDDGSRLRALRGTSVAPSPGRARWPAAIGRPARTNPSRDAIIAALGAFLTQI